MRESIFAEIDKERSYQDGKFGTSFDDKNTLNDWVTFITRYAGEAAFVANGAKADTIPFSIRLAQRQKLVKVAALAVAAIEAFDRNGQNFPRRHYDPKH